MNSNDIWIKWILQNSDVSRVSKLSLIFSCDKVLKVAFVRCRLLYCLKENSVEAHDQFVKRKALNHDRHLHSVALEILATLRSVIALQS